MYNNDDNVYNLLNTDNAASLALYIGLESPSPKHFDSGVLHFGLCRRPVVAAPIREPCPAYSAPIWRIVYSLETKPTVVNAELSANLNRGLPLTAMYASK